MNLNILPEIPGQAPDPRRVPGPIVVATIHTLNMLNCSCVFACCLCVCLFMFLCVRVFCSVCLVDVILIDS